MEWYKLKYSMTRGQGMIWHKVHDGNWHGMMAWPWMTWYDMKITDQDWLAWHEKTQVTVHYFALDMYATQFWAILYFHPKIASHPHWITLMGNQPTKRAIEITQHKITWSDTNLNCQDGRKWCSMTDLRWHKMTLHGKKWQDQITWCDMMWHDIQCDIGL